MCLHYNSIGRRSCVFKPAPSTFLSTGLPRSWIMSLPEVQRGQTKCLDKFRPQFCLFFSWSFSQIVAKQFREPARRVLNKFVQTASRFLPCCACAETRPEWRLSRFALRPPPGISVSAHPRVLGDRSDGVSVSAGQLRQRGAACGAGNLLLRAGAAVRGEGAPSWIQAGALRVGVGAYFCVRLHPVHHHCGLLPSRGAAHRRKQRQEGSAERFPSGAGRHAAFPRRRGTGTRPISIPSPPFPGSPQFLSHPVGSVSCFSVLAVMNTAGN